MRSKVSLLSLLLLLTCTTTLYARTDSEAPARKAVSANAKESGRAIAELRALGPAGLEALFRVYAEEINRQLTSPVTATTPEWQRLSAALDSVSQQKDSYISGLYWYTDLDKAREAARTSGKPILSLRLLGKLNEEFSCANSRFFRTILYSNADVSKLLRERFILHWQSVRPAPHITIDYGDGRKLERTITGNSIHYILTPDGRPIDALPGLYGPAAFLRALRSSEEGLKQMTAAVRPGGIVALPVPYHRARLAELNASWVADIEKTGGKVPQGFSVAQREKGAPIALVAGTTAATKMYIETPVLEAMTLRSMTAGSEALGKITDEAAWRKIAALHMADAQLDARSIALIKRQTQNVFAAQAAKTSPDEALAKLVNKLKMHIALDTVRNEYLLHPKLHEWLVVDPARGDLGRFTEKVYAELFLTPASDPWLGLFEPDIYMALENGGISR